MSRNNILLSIKNRESDWITIREAVNRGSRLSNTKITDSDIYRNALNGNILLSIYFQSPIFLRKVKTSNQRIKLSLTTNSFIDRLCLLEKNCFINGRKLVASTTGEYIRLAQGIIDTALKGYEYILIQQLLARTLHIPPPVLKPGIINYGISTTICGELFQIFEKITWKERIKEQTLLLPESLTQDNYKEDSLEEIKMYNNIDYFPIHKLPCDACFVIRHSELKKLINILLKNSTSTPSTNRLSTPLSRFFWLACKHNEAISPLIRKPYKLLSIFEQWASDDGITDRLSGDTLKNALERGSPSSTSLSN